MEVDLFVSINNIKYAFNISKKIIIPVVVAFVAVPLAAEQRFFEASNSDRALACSSAKREAENTARRFGKVLEGTSACDCSRRELDPQSAEGIAAKSVFGSTVKWTCQIDAKFK
jgi:hypothetical protein